MASEGGGKLKQKRSQSTSKPYDRRSTIFGKLKDSVKDLLIPSWLSGSDSAKEGKSDDGSSQGVMSVPNQRIPDRSDWPHSHQHTHRPDDCTLNSVSTIISHGNLTSGQQQLPGPNISSIVPHGPNVDVFLDQTPVQMSSKSNLHGNHQARMSGTKDKEYSHHMNETQMESRRLNSFEFKQKEPDFGVTPIRPIMVSTGLMKDSTSIPSGKRQRLSNPEVMRQGKPLVPASRGKPTFSSLLFNTPLKMDSSVLENSSGNSSFYIGKTRYGGASSVKKRDLNTSLPYQSSLPLRKQVKATRLNNSFHATTSSTAQRILDTLERMSTPLEDAKKIPRDQGNDSILSFTPSSYRRHSSQSFVRPITRPLQLPNRGPPTSQLQATSSIDIAKNRDSPKYRNEVQMPITQESAGTKQVSHPGFPETSAGKMKTKKFSQHIGGHREEEVCDVPNLRTDFTLPVSAMAPIALSGMNSEIASKSAESTRTPAVASSLKFTFSTPIEERKCLPNSRVSEQHGQKGFAFSSPIHISASKASAAGAEGGSKLPAEPAIGAATPTSAWSPQPVTKSKSMSPDIGGTSSSFKTYTKWNGSQKPEISSVPPSFGLPGPATCLKKGSVMDILGSGKSTSSPLGNKKDVEADQLTGSKGNVPLTDLFKKPEGTWECSTCMIQNKSASTKCLACETPKPSNKAGTAQGSNVPLSDLFKKPEGTWECSTCMIQNKSSSTKCLACETPKPSNKAGSSTNSTASLSDMFKKPEGSWECNDCLVQNSSTAVKCIACDSQKPGAVKTNNTSNNSLTSMFKKPEGSWDCDTCLIQNKTSSLKCIACNASKPGLQSAGVVSKPSPVSSSPIVISPSGGFSFSLPSTTTTTTGSAGFVFGNSSSVISTSASQLISGGFNMGASSQKDQNIENKDVAAPGPLSGGFQFGTSVPLSSSISSSSNNVQFGLTPSNSVSAPSGGFQFGAPTSIVSVTSAGFSLSAPTQNKLSSSISSTSVSLSAASSNNLTKSDTSAPAVGFQFGAGSGVSSPLSGEKSSSATFSFGANSSNPAAAAANKASPFVFGAPTSSQSQSTGLGTGQSISSSFAVPHINGGLGSEKKATFGSTGSGLNAGPALFEFGAKAPSSTTTKRSVDNADIGAPSAKMNPTFGSATQPALNGGFNFNGDKNSFGAASNATGFAFGSKPSQPSSGVHSGFQFSSAASSASSLKSEGSFSSTSSNFNFSAAAPASKVFQFGTNPTEAPAPGLFAFSASSNNPAPQPSVPAFGAAPAAAAGSFNIGTSDVGQRKVKKAVRRIKPR